MGDIAKYPVLPELSTIDFSDIADVRDLVRARGLRPAARVAG